MDGGFTEDYGELETKIGYIFHEKEFLRRALTHSSYANEVNLADGGKKARRKGHGAETAALSGEGESVAVSHNEKLEFLGDSILGYIIAEDLLNKNPRDDEGMLSKRRAAIVCESSLAASARDIGLGGYMRIGNNLRLEWGRKQNSILSDAMEAVFAAVYLDGGVEAVRNVIVRCLAKAMDGALIYDKVIDHKSRLQEYFFSVDNNVKIKYTVIDQSGPAHRRSFTSQVTVNGGALGEGEGGTKKESEQNAAKEALKRL